MQNRSRNMSSLNEQEKQLLETLLSQADAVSPSSERSRHAEHTEFHNSENDFHFLEKYINSSMGDEIENMAFSEHAASASFGDQGHGTNFQSGGQGQDGQQTGCVGPMFAQQPSAAYTGQQGSMQGYQQYTSPSAEHVPMTSAVEDSFQGQGTGYQQQFPMATQKSPLDQSSPAGGHYGNSSTTFTSPFKLDLGLGAQNSQLVGSSSAFTSSSSVLSFHSPSSAFPQSESSVETGQPETYHHSAGACQHPGPPAVGCGGADANSLSPGECPTQVTDYQQLQAFPSHFSPAAPSVVSVPAASAGNVQQQSPPGADADTSATVTNFSSQVSGFPAQQHQQNLLFQQGSPQSVLYLDKTLQESRHEASMVHFQADTSGFSQDHHQKQQQTEIFSHGGSAGPALSSPHGQQAGSFSQQQQTGQFQNILHSSGQAEQEVGNAGGPCGQLSNFHMQPSFQKPSNSPVQPPCLEQSASGSQNSFHSFPSSSQHSVCMMAASSSQTDLAAAGVCQNQVYQQQRDQSLEEAFHAQAPTSGFSHGAIQDDQIVSSTKTQSQSQCYVGEAAPPDQQTTGFVHHAFQLSSQTSRQDHEPMQEMPREKNMEAESTGFVASLSHPSRTVPFQDQAMEDSAGDGQFGGKSKLFDQQSSRLFDQQSSSPSRQQEQPMDTQQSPFYSGTTANPSQVFEAKTATLSLSQTHEAGDRFVSQSAGFQGKTNGLPASSAASSSDAGMQFQPFISSSLPIDSSVFSAKSELNSNTVCSSFTDSGLFNLQNMEVVGQGNGPVSFSDMATVPNASLGSPAASSLQPDVLKQTSASFKQFESGNGPAFVSSSTQQQQQQQVEHQPLQMTQQNVQQQHQVHVQHAVYPHNDQRRDSFSFSHNKSSKVLSALLGQEAGTQFGQDSSSAPTVLSIQTAAVQGGNSCPQDSSQFQATPLASGHHQGAAAPHVPSSTAHQPSPPFTFTSPGSGSDLSPASVTLMADKSPLAALFDSQHANAALNLLASVVLSQLQAILPHSAQVFAATQHQKQGAQGGMLASGPAPAPGATTDTVQQFLQTQADKNKMDSQLLVTQHQQAFQAPQVLQTAPSHLHHQSQGQAVAFQKSPAVPQMQPTFQTAQVPHQQAGFMPQQQLPQHLHQQESSSTSWQPQQQVLQLPSTLATNLGLTVSSSGQLMLGNQLVRLVIQPSTLDNGSGSSETPSTSLAGHAGVQQTVLPALMVSLPADLKNIDVQPLGSALVSSSHFTTTTTTPSLDSGIAGHSAASSFTMKQPVSATTAANTPSPAPSADSCGVRSASQDSTVTPFMTSAIDSLNVQAPALSSLPPANGESAVNVGNIFFPVNPSDTGTEKLMEVSQSSAGGIDSMGVFMNVTNSSGSMSLLNAFKMAVADQHEEIAEFKVPDGPTSQTVCSGNPCSVDSTKPMETNQTSVKSSILAMDVGDVTGQPYSDGLSDKTKVIDHGVSKRLVRKSSVEDKAEERLDTGSMLRRILTMEDDEPVEGLPNSNMLPEVSSPGNSPHKQDTESPNALVADTNTQTTLIEKSEKLDLSCDAQPDGDSPSEFWSSTGDFPVDEVVPPKVHKGLSDQDASCKMVSVPSVEKLFDAGGASSCSSFVFTKFGSEESSVFTFGTSQSSLVTTSATETKVTSVVSSSAVKQPDCVRLCVLPGPPIRPNSRRQREASLSAQFPSKVGMYELRILTQPEEQHRARYLTEGSRGAVKDRSQQGYPVIKLHGYKEPATLQVFIGNESGRIKPHGFYQACRVCGKNSTQCTEREIEGTTVIEIEMSPMNDMLISMDCVGILKLRNADVEKRIGIARAKAKKKNSTKARLVFRVTLRKPDGSWLTLQTASTPILCTQPVGQPEISRMSLSEMTVNQTKDLFIIGKNFLKGTRIMFQKLALDEKTVEWQSEAEIEAEYFQQTHLICKIPEYPRKDITKPVCVQILIQSGGKCSDPQDFIYTPAKILVKQEDPMETESSDRSLPFAVSPVALQLNRLVEQTQQEATSKSLFQLPPNMLPSITSSSVTSGSSRVPAGANTLSLSSPLLKPATFTLPSNSPGVLNFVTKTTPLISSSTTGSCLNMRTKATGLPAHILIPSLQPGQTGPAETGQSGLKFPKLLMVNPGMSLSAAPVTNCDSNTVSGSASGMGINTSSRLASSASVSTMAACTPATSSFVNNPLGGMGITTQSTNSCAPMIVILTTPASTTPAASNSGTTPQ